MLPLHWLNEGMLDLLVRGEGPTAMVVPTLLLAGFALALTLVSARLFRWDTH